MTQPLAEFARPTTEQLQALAQIPTAVLGDAMERFNVLHAAVSPAWGCGHVVGAAYTVTTREGDNAAIHEALESTAPGDLRVVDGRGALERALIGEMLAIKAKARGLGGFVLDGGVRDVEAIAELGVPVFARGRTPAGPHKSGPFRLLTPASVAGVVVSPGDAVVGDEDGVVVVPLADVDRVVDRARQVLAHEDEKRVVNARPLR